MTCETCNVTCQRFGKHRNGLRRFRCPQCKRTYTEPHQRALERRTFPKTHRARPAAFCSKAIRSGARNASPSLDRNTIMRLLVSCRGALLQPAGCPDAQTSLKYIQGDEIWTYVGRKLVTFAMTISRGRRSVGVRCDGRDTKLVPSFVIGKRIDRKPRLSCMNCMSELLSQRFSSPRTASHFLRARSRTHSAGT